MKGFLVVARYYADDFPIALFEREADAIAFTATNPLPTEEIVEHFHAAIEGEPITYEIVAFFDGRPCDINFALKAEQDAVRKAAHPNCPECKGTGWRASSDGASVERCNLCLPERLQTCRFGADFE